MLNPVTRTMLLVSLGVCLAVSVAFYWRRGAGHRVWIGVVLAAVGLALLVPYLLDGTGSATATLVLCIAMGLLALAGGFWLLLRREMRGAQAEEREEAASRRMLRFPAAGRLAQGAKAAPRALPSEAFAPDGPMEEEPVFLEEIAKETEGAQPGDADVRQEILFAEEPAPRPAAQPPVLTEEPEPMAIEPEPVVIEPEPVAIEPEPAAIEPEPVVIEPEPVAIEPMVIEPEPKAPADEPSPPESPDISGETGDELPPAPTRAGDEAMLDAAFALSFEERWSEAADAFETFAGTASDPWLRKQADFERLNALVEAVRWIDAIELTFGILESDYDLSSFEREQILAILEILQKEG